VEDAGRSDRVSEPTEIGQYRYSMIRRRGISKQPQDDEKLSSAHVSRSTEVTESDGLEGEVDE